MKTILLVCSAGMSTSLLVTKMEGAAKDAGVECKIFALPFSDAPRVLDLAHKLDSKKLLLKNWLLDVKQELSLLM